MSSMLSRFLRRQGKNLKKHGPAMLGITSMLGLNPLGLLGKTSFGSNLMGKLGGSQIGPLNEQGNFQGPFAQSGSPAAGAGNFIKGIGQNFLGLEDDKAMGGGLGLAMNLAGSVGQMNAGYDSGYLKSLNRQLNPLQDAQQILMDLSKGYMDPNSEMNQRMRNAIRGDELTSMSDVMDRAVSQSTGTYGDASQGNINMNALSDAIAKGLGNQSKQMADNFQRGANLAGSAGTLASSLGQQRLQNMILAQQKAQMPYQFLGQTGMGLLGRAYS